MRTLLLLLLIAACTPLTIPAGPPTTIPQFSGDALITADGLSLPLNIYAANKPLAVIVALHGFNDYAAHFDSAGAFWAEQGITTLAYDQRGFGRGPNRGYWGGSDAMIDDARAAVRLARRQYPGLPVYLLGASMGAAVAMAAADEGQKLPLDGLILVAPALWGWKETNDLYAGTLWITAHLAPGWTLTGSELNRIATDNLDFLRRMFADPNVIKGTRVDAIYGLVSMMARGSQAAPDLDLPTLILFGSSDEIVPEEPVKHAAAEVTGPCRFVYYQSGYHMLLVDLSAQRVWREIADFVLGRVKPAQAGCSETVVPPPEIKVRSFR